MAKKDLILIGGGGHCRSCIDVIEAGNDFHIAGIVDTEDRLHQKVLGYEIIGSDKDLPDLAGKYREFFITIGSIQEPAPRIEKFEYLKRSGGRFPVIVSPLAHVARSAALEEGTIVMHQALINSHARIGRNCIINTSALIEHDATIGDHCHISTGSIVNGTCHIGNRVFVGSNSVIANDVDVVDDVIIGAGTIVTRSIDEAGTYVGNPARKKSTDKTYERVSLSHE